MITGMPTLNRNYPKGMARVDTTAEACSYGFRGMFAGRWYPAETVHTADASNATGIELNRITKNLVHEWLVPRLARFPKS